MRATYAVFAPAKLILTDGYMRFMFQVWVEVGEDRKERAVLTARMHLAMLLGGQG